MGVAQLLLGDLRACRESPLKGGLSFFPSEGRTASSRGIEASLLIWYFCHIDRRNRLIFNARANRKDLTLAASLLWGRLRAGQLGVKFRREDPIGPYIADFSCRSHRLVIEADGESHTDPDRDCARDSWFLDHGWFVLRFTNEEIIESLYEVINSIDRALESPHEVMDNLNDGKPHRWCTSPHRKSSL